MNRSIRLEQVHIPEPCHADWSAMVGDERTRFCDACGKHVHDLSARSRREGEALLAEHTGGRLCVQMTLDYQGRPVTRDGPRAWPVVRWVWPAASAAVALTLALLGCRKQEASVVAGGIRAPTTQTQLAGAIAPSVMLMGDIDIPSTTQPSTQPATHPAVLRGKIVAPTTPSAD
jgi:hypothetical protein